MNLEKEFVPHEPSLALKELGFDEPCFAFYNGKFIQSTEFDFDSYNSIDVGHHPLAPTFSQAFRWFREKRDWQHSIEPTADQYSHQLGYNYWIWNYKTGEEYHTMPKNRPSGDWEYKSYEEAELACLIKLIEIVKEKKNG